MNSSLDNPNHFSSFWPLGLLAFSLALFLGWQVTMAIRQSIAFQRAVEQQNVMAGQATQAENALKALMIDLLALSKINADARAIVSKYGIKFNPAPAQVPDASESPPRVRPR